jgi:hypothetical protein
VAPLKGAEGSDPTRYSGAARVFPGRLSDAGLQYGGYVTMGRHPKPFTTADVQAKPVVV